MRLQETIKATNVINLESEVKTIRDQTENV